MRKFSGDELGVGVLVGPRCGSASDLLPDETRESLSESGRKARKVGRWSLSSVLAVYCVGQGKKVEERSSGSCAAPVQAGPRYPISSVGLGHGR